MSKPTVKVTKRKPTGAAAMGPGPGRPKGIPNKTTKALKDMILGALDDAGGQTFLLRQARKKNNAPFMALVGKVLPMQITGEDGGPVKFDVKTMTDEQLQEVIRKVAEGLK